jgi:pSer/pThr/pTyr-binding forkhead associated (FHA) protein
MLIEARQGIVAVPILRRAIRIGSSSNDHVRIRHLSVVPRHAVAELTEQGVTLIIDRSDDVFVNGRRVKVTRLGDRDHLTIGKAELLIVAVPTSQDDND